MEIMDWNINVFFMFFIFEKYNELGIMVMGKIEFGYVKKGDILFMMFNKVNLNVFIIVYVCILIMDFFSILLKLLVFFLNN